MMKAKSVLIVLAVALFLVTSASAQSELALRLNRDFGYGGFDNKVEGLFSLHASGPDDLAHVDFYIDDTLMSSITTPPFSFQFSTSDYPPGEHRLVAVGFTVDGAELSSNEIVSVFLTKDEAGQQTFGLIVPVAIGIIALMAIMAVVSTLIGSRTVFKGTYGMLGGTVCPRCTLPYSLSIWAPRLVIARVQRCPHCGKWALVRRAAPAELAAAEERWRGNQAVVPGVDDEAQRAKRQIDDSRYEK
jgi:hypothetical protein